MSGHSKDEGLERRPRSLTCSKCGGEGQLYTSKYGGNDPDVWPVGECPVCEGSCAEPCSSRGCDREANGFNDDGEALCEYCLQEWAQNYGEEPCFS